MHNEPPLAPRGGDSTSGAKASGVLPPSAPDFARINTIPPRPWPGARLGKCLVNVLTVIQEHGGEAAFGWAIEYGPLRLQTWYPPPLYSRWLNHVVWRDPAGELWEVSPHITLNDMQGMRFLPTQFIVDASATFDVQSEEDWNTRPCRYLALRPAGEAVAACLNQAQAAVTEADRTHWIQQALASLPAAGFTPREWKVETVGERTGTIWLFAD